jgi:hypothetical protein
MANVIAYVFGLVKKLVTEALVSINSNRIPQLSLTYKALILPSAALSNATFFFKEFTTWWTRDSCVLRYIFKQFQVPNLEFN